MSDNIFKLSTGLLAGTMISGLAYAGNPAPPSYTPDLVPANPETGECYARVEIPAQYSTETETVVVKEGFADLSVTEPQLRTRQENIMVKEPSVRYEVRQPTYRTVTEQVMVRPAYEKLEVTRPQFRDVTETMTVSNSRLVWKRGNPAKLRAQGYKIHSIADGGVAGRGYRSTVEYGRTKVEPELCGQACEVWCLVEEPGETVSFNRKVLTNPASVRRVPVPAKYTSVTKQVVADPGGVREIPVPAEYQSLTIEELTGGGDVREVERPPEYGTVGKRVLVQDGRYEWRRIVCKPGTHPADRGVPLPSLSGTVSSSMTSSSGYSNGYSSGSSSGYQGYSGTTHSGYSSHSGTAMQGRTTPYGSRSTYGNVQSHGGSMTYGGTASSGGYVSGGTYSGGGHTSGSSSYSQGSTYQGGSTTGSTSRGTYYYGSDLPTYSEDYRLPPTTNEEQTSYHTRGRPARMKKRYE